MALTASSAVACLLLVLASTVAAGSPPTTLAVDCIAAVKMVAGCCDFVSPGSTKRRPSKACCRDVKAGVANATLIGCICTMLGSGGAALPIVKNRVLALTGACGAYNTIFTKCHIAVGPAPFPSPSGGGLESPRPWQ